MKAVKGSGDYRIEKLLKNSFKTMLRHVTVNNINATLAISRVWRTVLLVCLSNSMIPDTCSSLPAPSW